MTEQPVGIVEYDPGWADLFEQERPSATEALRPWLSGGIEHVGSTAVPGLRARPVIDMLAPVQSLEEAHAAIPALAEAGWQHWPEDPEAKMRLCFFRPAVAKYTHRLQVISADHPQTRALEAFRDALRENKALRIEYAALKEWMAKRHQHNRSSYTNAKSAFVERVLRDAGIEPPLRSRLPD